MKNALAVARSAPGGRSKVRNFAPRDRWGKLLIHKRDIGGRGYQARVAHMLRQNKPLLRKAGCNARRYSRQAAETAMRILDHVGAVR